MNPSSVIEKVIKTGIRRILYIRERCGYLWHLFHTMPTKHGLNTNPRDKKIIVSLTTIPSRIKYVPIAIGSILHQSVKPDEIRVYLGKEYFSDVELPKKLRKLQKCGVKIEYVPDLKVHTKWYYTMQTYRNDIVILMDDDTAYPRKRIEDLYTSYLNNRNAVSAYRVHRITYNPDGTIAPYNSWDFEYTKQANQPLFSLFGVGVGGILYPPNSLHEEVFNIEKFMKLTPTADDVWLKMMSIMNNTPTVSIGRYKAGVTIAPSKTQKARLSIDNRNNGKNDVQIKAVMKEYNTYFGTEDTLLSRLKQDGC